MGSRNSSTTAKVVHAVFACASSDYSSTSLYMGDGNKYVAANATEGTAGGIKSIPGLDPNKNYLITRMEATFGTAPGGSKTATLVVRTDHVTPFTMAAGLDIRDGSSTLTGTIAGASATTLDTQALIPLAAKDSVTIKVSSGDAACAATTIVVILTIEERN